MSHSLSDLLLRYAQQFEDQHAPQNMTIALREAARELDRLYAGGCARDQGTTQYCAEAARLAAENERLRAALGQDKPRAAWADVCVKNQLLCEEIERLRAALKPFADLAKYYDPEEDDEADQIVWYEAGKPTIGDLRRARAALKEPRT